MRKRTAIVILLGGVAFLILGLISSYQNWGLSLGVGLLLGMCLGWSIPRILAGGRKKHDT